MNHLFILMLSALNLLARSFGTCMAAESLAGVFSISYITAPNHDIAKSIAKDLVNQKLAACVNIIPGIESVYEWKNEVQVDSEVLMMVKSRTSRLDEMTKFVRERHPYDVCEVISVPIQHGNSEYLKWIGDVVPEAGSN